MAVPAQSRLLIALSGLIGVVNAISYVVLMALFFHQGDVVWGSCCLAFIVLSTALNLLLSLYDHPNVQGKCLFWVVLSVLQLKAWGDTLEILAHPQLQGELRDEDAIAVHKHYRAKKFLASVIQSLPMSFLLCYILMLDLGGRMNEHLLAAALFLSFVSFAVGTTHFAACNEPLWMDLVVFVQALAQFTLRMLAVCAVCVRFRVFGMVGMAVMWLIVYCFGPQGSWSIWAKSCCSSTPERGGVAKGLLRVLITPLSFFIVMNAKFEVPGAPHEPMRAHHCFTDTGFLLWRLVENIAQVTLFVLVPARNGIREADEYEEWLTHPLYLAILSGVSVFLILTTWMVISNSRPSPSKLLYARQVDDAQESGVDLDEPRL